MADPVPTPSSDEPTPQDIRALLEEIRRQNVSLKRYVCVLGIGVTLLLLIATNLMGTIINYAVAVAIVLAVLLTAPLWSPLIVSLTERITWYPKRKKDRRDTADIA